MNGRIYDPLLGRMLSADLLVQDPGSLQSYNRYSYVRNNPLTWIDPSGWADNGSSNSGGLTDQLKSLWHTLFPARAPGNETSEVDTPQQQPQEQQQFRAQVRGGIDNAGRVAQGQLKVLEVADNAVTGGLCLDAAKGAVGMDQNGRPVSKSGAMVNMAKDATVLVGVTVGAEVAKPLVEAASEAAGTVVKDVVKALGGGGAPIERTEGEAVSAALNSGISPYVAKPGEVVNPSKVAVYRGGTDMTIKPGEVRIDKATGLVKPTRGPSLNTNPASPNIVNNGGPNQVTSVPDSLQIKNTSAASGTHLEIVPKEPMKHGTFQDLLDRIFNSD